MLSVLQMRIQAILAATCAFALRLFFLLRFPVSGPGDSQLYEELARNWLDRGIYGIQVAGHLMPVDLRAPGYPAFLAVVYATLGRSVFRVAVAQALLDTTTCFLIAALAARLVLPEEKTEPAPGRADTSASRKRVFLAALWLAAFCPFTANYTAAVLAETLAIFFMALALCALAAPGGVTELPGGAPRVLEKSCLLGGIAVGLGTLARPETPLILVALALVLLWRCRRPVNWPRLMHAGVLLGCGLILSLAPWIVRNAITLHEFQPLAPRYADLPGEYHPAGFEAWTDTWLWHFRDVYLVSWNVNDKPIDIENVPAGAFDTHEERTRVQEALDQYNDVTTLTPEMDRLFAELARERTRRHPLRTWVKIPVLRAGAMWFTPRIELLPYSGRLWPVSTAWEDDPIDFGVTLGFVLLNIVYVILAIVGAWRIRRRPAAAFLILFVLLRTAFFTTVETPEPRYVLECFPALLALGAFAFLHPARD
jgi:4-amino-4-deoxy-L-arabinose transferase-like glycosyltransferase